MLSRDENLNRYLTDNLLLEHLAATSAQMGFDCWLVGGAIRDVLLGNPVTDVDLVTTADPTPLARQWAELQGAHWFWLDKERRQSRVLLRYGKLEFYFDFAPLRAETLLQDLTLRDFTINALALPLILPLPEQILLDPLNGLDDLNSSTIRYCSDKSLKDDPLRILKGIRHAVTLSFQLGSETEAQMRELSEFLETMAGERKRNELGRIFSSDNLIHGLTLLERCLLIPVLFGPSGKTFTVAEIASEFTSFQLILKQWMDREPLEKLLDELFDESINRRTLYLLAFFLRYYKSAELGSVLNEKLRLSRRATTVLNKLVTLDFELLTKINTLPDRPRARSLWLESLGPAPVDQLLFFAAAEQPDYLHVSTMQTIIDEYFSTTIYGKVPDLLSGRDIKKLLPEINGKLIGQYQKKVKEAEITGEIVTQKDAKKLLLVENSIDKV